MVVGRFLGAGQQILAADSQICLLYTSMAVRELAIPLTTGIQKVFRQRQELRFANIRLPQEGSIRVVDLRIRPLPEKKGQEPLVAVFVEEIKKNEVVETDPSIQSYDFSKATEERLRDLEQDLQFTRENLQATIEEPVSYTHLVFTLGQNQRYNAKRLAKHLLDHASVSYTHLPRAG